jgi:hypothetical protein
MRSTQLYILGLFTFLIWGCREPFEPEIENVQGGVLVVEGYLDSNGLESILSLSRTAPIGGVESFVPETGAKISLRASTGQLIDLIEQKNGQYLFERDIAENQSYILEILLKNGEKYLSEPIIPIQTPEILDAGFVRDEEGVEVFLNTQGNQDADDFLWTYEETWVFRPEIRTPYIYRTDSKVVELRKEEEKIDLCYKSVVNSDLLLETSSRFEDQVVFRQTIKEIPQGDERLMERYSILISQKAIDQKAVEFWETIKRNTDDIGSIFSPLPSIITGNIRLDGNGNKPVVGYVSLGVVKQKRIFIDQREVSPWNFNDPAFDDCFISQEPVYIGSAQYFSDFGTGSVLPARELMQGTTIVAYYTSSRRCSDCTLYADRKRPEFWED